MHHASGNCFVGQPVCLWIWKFNIDHAIYILDYVWLVIFGKEDENVCMRQPTLLKLNDILQSCILEYASCKCHWSIPLDGFWTLGLPNPVNLEVAIRVATLSWFQAIGDYKWI
jgi:hypothetical protein